MSVPPNKIARMLQQQSPQIGQSPMGRMPGRMSQAAPTQSGYAAQAQSMSQQPMSQQAMPPPGTQEQMAMRAYMPDGQQAPQVMDFSKIGQGQNPKAMSGAGGAKINQPPNPKAMSGAAMQNAQQMPRY